MDKWWDDEGEGREASKMETPPREQSNKYAQYVKGAVLAEGPANGSVSQMKPNAGSRPDAYAGTRLCGY